ncbi:hypothetical protein QJS10_CPB21g01098 [Acorus calamus]|uniref:Uncharacterized protein n=1 Tax=Acorus calamus TaxID=4465 RepID=A0AAV9C2Y2_ACOCL|nr:hypothetical protein QJS10_CPB21g01098 [Acorus calamus]
MSASHGIWSHGNPNSEIHQRRPPPRRVPLTPPLLLPQWDPPTPSLSLVHPIHVDHAVGHIPTNKVHKDIGLKGIVRPFLSKSMLVQYIWRVPHKGNEHEMGATGHTKVPKGKSEIEYDMSATGDNLIGRVQQWSMGTGRRVESGRGSAGDEAKIATGEASQQRDIGGRDEGMEGEIGEDSHWGGLSTMRYL